jgi:hypothetical protein
MRENLLELWLQTPGYRLQLSDPRFPAEARSLKPEVEVLAFRLKPEA